MLNPPDPLPPRAAFAFSPDGSLLYVLTPDCSLSRWDLKALRRELAKMGLDWE